jgi:protoheme IX farnesyltransferase
MKSYLALAKPRIALMVVLTTALGYALAGGASDWKMLWTLVGTGLSACACGALNQLLEIEQDGRMKRTSKRPLPAGDLSPRQALAFGLATAFLGLGTLRLLSGRLAFDVTAFTLVAYVLFYTPLKMITPQTTWIGAAAGATPPLVGWAAAAGDLPLRAWALFAIMFLWQIPHFLALFWTYREDYARAGFKTAPVVDPRGGLTAAQIAIHSLSVLPVSLLPVFLGMAGLKYGAGALVLSTAYLLLGLKASWTLAALDTRRLFLASLAYLPILFGMLLIGGV